MLLCGDKANGNLYKINFKYISNKDMHESPLYFTPKCPDPGGMTGETLSFINSSATALKTWKKPTIKVHVFWNRHEY